MMPFLNKQIVFIDFETFYSRADGYDLKAMSMTEYIRDPRFKVHGHATATLTSDVYWCGGRFAEPLRNDWDKVVLVAHNVKFDGAILAWKYGIYPSLYVDTKSLARAVLGGRLPGYSLAEVAHYLGLQAKGELKWDGVRDLTEYQEREMADYCLNDVRLCRDIFNLLIKEFPASELPVMDWTIRCLTAPTLRLNLNVLEKGVADEKARREKAIRDSGVSREVLASNQQFAGLLGSRGIVVPTKTSPRTGRETAALALGDPQFLSLREKAPDLFAGRIAAKSTINETRGKALIDVGRTGAFPFDVQYSGATQTHRFSGGNSAGGNPQNFPRKGFLRAAIEAPTGETQLVVGDFANIELRILAWLAQEPKLINAIVKGTDIYSEFASLIYKKPITKANPKERHFGKCAILGLGYGMGFNKFRTTVRVETGMDITEEMAREVVGLYRSTYFNVPKLWELAEKTIPFIVDPRVKCVLFAPYIKIEKEALVLPSGLKMRYPKLRQERSQYGYEWFYDTFKRKGGSEPTKLYGGKLVENICQALAGEICKLAIIRGLKRGLTIAGQVHDELICVGTAEDKQILKDVMEEFIPWLPSITIKAEVGAGRTWLDAK